MRYKNSELKGTLHGKADLAHKHTSEFFLTNF